jgi:hypothetical protein
MHLSAHQPQYQLAACERLLCGAIMKVTVKTARLRSNQGKSPFSAVACLIFLMLAGILVKFAAMTPVFYAFHWD